MLANFEFSLKFSIIAHLHLQTNAFITIIIKDAYFSTFIITMIETYNYFILLHLHLHQLQKTFFEKVVEIN